MLFNSFEYLFLFLPVTLILFQILARAPSTERQIYWLVLASGIFYASWKPVYLLLIVASVVVNFLLGKRLARADPGRVRHWLAIGVGFNLGLLGYFKYTGFFLDGLNALGLWLIPIPEITLPLAISFFTFQQIAYLVDVSRGDCREYQFHHYVLFVMFFPQLIAGPIVHHKEMMPQFDSLRPRAEVSTDFSVGFTLIAIGLFKKVVLADSLGEIVDPVFAAAGNGQSLSQVDALLGTFGFSFQIYFDFSGYSDIAIGSARLFGIRLPENFRSPYKSASMIEMWRRWHMTLSRFLRDYLYIALGGNRHGTLKRYRNLMITMLLGGLWHGAAWTFVFWGGLQGIYLCINHGWRAMAKRVTIINRLQRPVFAPLFILLTFTAWAIAFVLFRADSTATAWSIIETGFLGLSGNKSLLLSGVLSDSLIREAALLVGTRLPPYTEIYLLLVASAAICWLLPNSQEFLADYRPTLVEGEVTLRRPVIRWQPGLLNAAITAALFTISVLSITSMSRFIYFQF
jgi:alginate O-acetyltransferase complex protein AlgI